MDSDENACSEQWSLWCDFLNELKNSCSSKKKHGKKVAYLCVADAVKVESFVEAGEQDVAVRRIEQEGLTKVFACDVALSAVVTVIHLLLVLVTLVEQSVSFLYIESGVLQ